MTCTSGAMFAAMKKTATWKTSTRMPVQTSERGATTASRTGRMMALRTAITTTISTAPIGRSITMDGTSHSVTRKEITETTRTMIRRLISAAGPPRHSRSTLIWVR